MNASRTKTYALPQPRDLAAEMVQRPDGMWVSPEKLLDGALGVNLSYPPRVLTVKQPYADFITANEAMCQMFAAHSRPLGQLLPKRVENRSWRTDWRGVIFIHAGARLDREEIRFWGLDTGMFVTRAIVGTAQLMSITIDEDLNWARAGSKQWMLTNPQRLTRPIPHLTGGLALMHPTPELVAQVRDQLVAQVLGRPDPEHELEVHPSHDPEPDGQRLYPGGQTCRRCCHFVTLDTFGWKVTEVGVKPCKPGRITVRNAAQ